MPVSYLVADVDNREGTEYINMYMVSAFDKEGRQYSFTTVTNAVDKWRPSYGSDYRWTLPNGTVLDEASGSTLNGEAADLNNGNLADIDPAERATVILASNDVDLPDEFTRVSVLPSGGLTEAEEARPVAG